MKTRFMIVTFFVGAALTSLAGQPVTQTNAVLTSSAGTSWDTNSILWLDLTSGTNQPPAVRLGKSDFTVSGPLIEGFRHHRSTEPRSLGQKILSLPIVCLFVPQRLPPAPTGGRYFASGESPRAWTSIATGTPPGSGFDSVRNEPRGRLVSVEW